MGVLCYIMPMPRGRLHWNMIWIYLLDYSNHGITYSTISHWLDEWLDWKGTELRHYGRLRVKCECYTYLLIYVQISGNISYLLHAIYIMRCTGFVFGPETIHWACGCSNPPLSPFSPGIKVLKIIELVAILCSSVWSDEVSLYAHVHVSSICNLYLNTYENMYVISSMKELCIAFIWVALYGHVRQPSVRLMSL